jgi:hypothetical protein
MENIKILKFVSKLVPLILKGEKDSTWRLFDDKDLKPGDKLSLVEKESGKKFGEAVILSVREKILGEIEANDFDGHEKFESKEKMFDTYKNYYGEKVNEESVVKIIKFKLL